MKLSTLILALGAMLAADAASAAPITVLNATPAVRQAPAPRCTTLPPSANGLDVECVVTLSQQPGRARAPGAILIRTEVVQTSCASKDAQVVRLSGASAAPQHLPLVEHAGAGRACGS
jgi:hypothetical protein